MLSSKVQYACLALAELAHQHAGGGPVGAARIAERHGIPATFLVQILQELKRARLVESVRGAGGGYRLRVAPEQTTLAEVVDVFEPAADQSADCAAERSPLASAMEQLCREMHEDRRRRLQQVTLADLAASLAAQAAPMWHI